MARDGISRKVFSVLLDPRELTQLAGITFNDDATEPNRGANALAFINCWKMLWKTQITLKIIWLCTIHRLGEKFKKLNERFPPFHVPLAL